MADLQTRVMNLQNEVVDLKQRNQDLQTQAQWTQQLQDKLSAAQAEVWSSLLCCLYLTCLSACYNTLNEIAISIMMMLILMILLLMMIMIARMVRR